WLVAKWVFEEQLHEKLRVVYADGSSTDGYLVDDMVHYDQVSGNLSTMSANATVTFGFGAKQSGHFVTSTKALDGLLGFGQANTSMISQLAAAGKVKKMFAHCLDGGGRIFAIGQEGDDNRLRWSGELPFVNTPEFRLFDMRTVHQLQVYQQPGGSDIHTVYSTSFSSYDRLLFAYIPIGIALFGILY
ncbi:hypothetical protein MKX03_004459, partial [Papaver bracteatum]